MSNQERSESNRRTGGEILIDQLVLNNSYTIFCVPGESYLPALDALYTRDLINLITCRHEASAANMAAAFGRLTHRPGVAFVTRGPGAFHASIGVHTAAQDSSPMLLLVGQISSPNRGREAFQEVDYEKVFASVAKWVVRVDSAARLPELLGRAFRLAATGRPGPVVVALPQDILESVVDVDDGRAYDAASPALVGPKPDPTPAYTLLSQSRRPVVIVGGSTWTMDGCVSIRQFAESHDIPLVTSFRRQDLVDNSSFIYAGTLGPGTDPSLTDRLSQADLIMSIGARSGEITTVPDTFMAVPTPKQTFVHVHPSLEELSRVYQPDLAVNSDVTQFAKALNAMTGLDDGRFAEWSGAARNDFLVFRTPPKPSTLEPEANDYVDLATAVGHLNEVLPDNAILSNGAGNYTLWAHRYFQFHNSRIQLAPISGAMGYGLPAALAGKIVFPDREVVIIAGDGCLMMVINELATAMQYSLAIVVLVVNNMSYGTIRMHQERQYPGRAVGTTLENPDFVDLARSFGAYGELVTTNEKFPEALNRARNAHTPAIIELRTDPRRLAPEVWSE